MEYELAKKLKDKGFPNMEFNFGSGKYVFEKITEENDGNITTGNAIKIPTLEELIEACGDGYFHLHREGDIWRAKTYPLDWATGSSTPSEAVANLWLALKDKI